MQKWNWNGLKFILWWCHCTGFFYFAAHFVVFDLLKLIEWKLKFMLSALFVLRFHPFSSALHNVIVNCTEVFIGRTCTNDCVRQMLGTGVNWVFRYCIAGAIDHLMFVGKQFTHKFKSAMRNHFVSMPNDLKSVHIDNGWFSLQW